MIKILLTFVEICGIQKGVMGIDYYLKYVCKLRSFQIFHLFYSVYQQYECNIGQSKLSNNTSHGFGGSSDGTFVNSGSFTREEQKLLVVH